MHVLGKLSRILNSNAKRVSLVIFPTGGMKFGVSPGILDSNATRASLVIFQTGQNHRRVYRNPPARCGIL